MMGGGGGGGSGSCWLIGSLVIVSDRLVSW